MGKNQGNGTRRGPVKERTQTYNPKTKKYVKRGKDGKFLSCKKSDGPYKGVRREEGCKKVEEKAT